MEMLRRGAQGSAVRLLQQGFNFAMPLVQPLTLDGMFGPQTEQRAKEFQSVKGLAADGIVGPLTLGALVRAERLTVRVSLLRQPPAPASQPLFLMSPPARPQLPALRLNGGPEFTPFRYDPSDGLWVQEMRDWLTWLSLPPGAATKPPRLPSLLPPSGSLLLRSEIMKQFPWLRLTPPSLILPGPPTLPSVLPVVQERLQLNGPPRQYTVPPTGWTTELQLEGSAAFNPLKPDKPIKTELEFTANLYRIGFLGKKGEFDAGGKITPFESPLVRGVASVQVKPFKWESETTGLSLALVLAASLTLPPAELEGKIGPKLEWEWTKPLGAPRGLEGKLGLWAGSKFSIKQDENSTISAQFYPLLIQGFITFGAAEERQPAR